jgi:hypothetical protein
MHGERIKIVILFPWLVYLSNIAFGYRFGVFAWSLYSRSHEWWTCKLDAPNNTNCRVCQLSVRYTGVSGTHQYSGPDKWRNVGFFLCFVTQAERVGGKRTSSQHSSQCHPSTAWLVSKSGKCVTSKLRFKCDSTRAENSFRLSTKRTSPFKSVGASVQSTTGSRGVRISGSILDTPYSEVLWMVLATYSIRQFPFHSHFCASPCAITFQMDSTPVVGITSCQRECE